MVKHENIKKYMNFRLDCPHLYKDCGSVDPKSNCAKCFEEKKYNKKNGYSYEDIQKKETANLEKIVRISKTVSL